MFLISSLLIPLSEMVKYCFEGKNKYVIVSLRSEMKRAFKAIKLKYLNLNDMLSHLRGKDQLSLSRISLAIFHIFSAINSFHERQ